MKKSITYYIRKSIPAFNLVQDCSIKRSVLTLLTVSLFMINHAGAANLSHELTELSDETLMHMRGKFISAGEMRYFGVEMVTYWQASTGELIIATANLGVDFTSSNPQIGFMPTITVQQNNAVTSASPAANSNAVVTGGDGLNDVTGVVQNIQVAGVSNGITNTIGLTVEASSTPTHIGLPLVSGSQSLSELTPNGATVNVDLSNNQMGVAVTVPNQGLTIQHIRNTATGGQVQQSAQVGGNLNQIRNLINLKIATDPLHVKLSSEVINSVLSSIRLLAPTGSL
jgi:hypothetical protein